MAKKISVLTDVTVEVDPPQPYGYWTSTQERIAEWHEQWVKEFNEFVRDHRSQDQVVLHVVRKHEECCSECKRVWDEMKDEDTGKPACGWCGAVLETEEEKCPVPTTSASS